MKIALVSGFLNDHLLPLCEEFNKQCEFHFIATQDLSKTQLQYRDEVQKDYILRYYHPLEHDAALSEVLNCDIVIFGGSSFELLQLRKQTNKISFIYTERFLKKGSWRRFIPSTAKILKEQFLDNNENLYVLCSGSFVSKDLKTIGFDADKCFKFGYFPKTEKLPLEELLQKKESDPLKLLFVGRLLKLKRAIDTLKCCKKLNDNGINFELNVIGDGPERKNLERYAQKHSLNQINFLGSQDKSAVLEYMQQSHLCFVNSNRMEGWAAITNESLSQACPIIISNTCGSAAYLIKNAHNGFCYPVGNVSKLFEKTMEFVRSKDKTVLFKNAYATIWDEWNAKTAVNHFIEVSQALIKNDKTPNYTDGPLSKD